MKEFIIVGADISKATIDFHFKPTEKFMCIENCVKAFKQWLKESKLLSETGVLVVMEHTGRYSRKFENFLATNAIGYCKLPALEIKRSMGMQRGKSDKIDAKRIAEYGWLRRNILAAEVPSDNDIVKLKDLWSLRAKLVRDRSGFINRLKELKATEVKVDKYFQKIHQDYIDKFTRDIVQLEEKIKEVISANEALQKTYNLICSIKGVGLIVATYMITTTSNFTKFDNARKFNCYAGLAPFKYESGSSIKGKSRVSHLANKAAKALLNLAASSAVRCNSDLKRYYQKRVAEGKNKMSCLNIIRAKIVARIFAVVKRQSPYVEIYIAA
jgi:transposase